MVGDQVLAQSRTARALIVALAGGLLAVAGCSSIQQEADAEAARVADHVLPRAVESRVLGAGNEHPEQRAADAAAWLADPDESVLDSQGGTTWVVRGRDGSTLRVDVYTFWESGSFLPPDQGASSWGVACRSYQIGRGVTSRPMQCPEGTPESP